MSIKHRLEGRKQAEKMRLWLEYGLKEGENCMLGGGI